MSAPRQLCSLLQSHIKQGWVCCSKDGSNISEDGELWMCVAHRMGELELSLFLAFLCDFKGALDPIFCFKYYHLKLKNLLAPICHRKPNKKTLNSFRRDGAPFRRPSTPGTLLAQKSIFMKLERCFATHTFHNVIIHSHRLSLNAYQPWQHLFASKADCK